MLVKLLLFSMFVWSVAHVVHVSFKNGTSFLDRCLVSVLKDWGRGKSPSSFCTSTFFFFYKKVKYIK